jgi:hypothetical protein
MEDLELHQLQDLLQEHLLQHQDQLQLQHHLLQHQLLLLEHHLVKLNQSEDVEELVPLEQPLAELYVWQNATQELVVEHLVVEDMLKDVLNITKADMKEDVKNITEEEQDLLQLQLLHLLLSKHQQHQLD